MIIIIIIISITIYLCFCFYHYDNLLLLFHYYHQTYLSVVYRNQKNPWTIYVFFFLLYQACEDLNKRLWEKINKSLLWKRHAIIFYDKSDVSF